jgi:diguanylate cyclase (GGDEF)-like protein/PAS domain S-box-containing protein
VNRVATFLKDLHIDPPSGRFEPNDRVRLCYWGNRLVEIQSDLRGALETFRFAGEKLMACAPIPEALRAMFDGGRQKARWTAIGKESRQAFEISLAESPDGQYRIIDILDVSAHRRTQVSKDNVSHSWREFADAAEPFAVVTGEGALKLANTNFARLFSGRDLSQANLLDVLNISLHKDNYSSEVIGPEGEVYRMKVSTVEGGDRVVRLLEKRQERLLERQNRTLRTDLRKMARRYEHIVGSITDYVYSVEVKDGQVARTRHSEGCFAVTGYRRRDLHTDPELWIKMVHPEDRPTVISRSQNALAGTEVPPFEHRILHRDGSTRWVKNTPVLIFEDGKLVAYEGLVQDITERKEAEHELQALNERLQAANRQLKSYLREDAWLAELSNAMQSVWRRDEAINLIHEWMPKIFHDCSGALWLRDGSWHGLRVSTEWGPKGMDLSGGAQICSWHSAPTEAHCDCLHDFDETSLPHHTVLCVPIKAQGAQAGMLKIALSNAVLSLNQDSYSETVEGRRNLLGRVADLIGLCLSNVSLREGLEDQAFKDPLTGLLNRRGMEQAFELRFAEAMQHQTPISLIMADLDHFKHLNDAYGHDAGDEVLREFAQVLHSGVRHRDVACRFGGEEFVVMLVGADEEVALQRAEQLRQRLEKRAFEFEGKPLPKITSSFGVATRTVDGGDWKTMLQQADDALYQAKARGRNRVEPAAA